MYTADQRSELRAALLDDAAADARIVAAAITGSAAEGREDRWSDIDLAFGVGAEAEIPGALSDWTARMYERHGAAHHFDMQFGTWTYRVFLLAGTLQVDLAFAPAADFRALGPTFRLVFGEAQESRTGAAPAVEGLIGMAWLYAVHARTAIARGQLWQAEHMIHGVRENALALACVRRGVPAVHAKGVDRLPEEVKGRFAGSLVREWSATEMARAFEVVVRGLVGEIGLADPGLAGRLAGVMGELVKSLN